MLYLLMLANNMKVFHICFIPLCNLHGIMKYSELYKRQFQMVLIRVWSPCLMCIAAECLLAENSTVCDVRVTLAAFTAEGHWVSEN